MKNSGQISDILRFILLHRFGGIYADFDMECLRDPASLFAEDIFFSFAPPPVLFVSNAIFGCNRPGNPVWAELIQLFCRRFKPMHTTFGAVNLSGSILLTHVVQNNLLLGHCKSPEILLPFHTDQLDSALTVHHSNQTWKNG